jgi:hypothetical protein
MTPTTETLNVESAAPAAAVFGNQEGHVLPAAAEPADSTAKARDADAPLVMFADVRSPLARTVVLLRERAVLASRTVGVDQVVADLRAAEPAFRISRASLYLWRSRHQLWGLDGLVEQKTGRSGRPPVARHLSSDQILSARAEAVELGTGGALNIARATRRLIADPTLSHEARNHLHGAHASKSYVPPSVRETLRVSPLTIGLLRVGPKYARLNGRWTPCSYEDVRAGDVVTADDMTANCYVWLEWPNDRGFMVMRPQILAMLDVGSLAWTNLRAVFRARGQYCRDDVWGLVGDFLDNPGRPKAFLFEGGTWRSNDVLGHKTGLDDETRFAGLRSLGIRLYHSRSPRSKVIEGAFNQLQYASDNCPGYCGRAEMRDRPEILKQQLLAIERGKSHPSQHLLHARDYVEHLTRVMHDLNYERQDGKILRGLCPADKWAQDNPMFDQFPNSSKWLYRSAYRVVTVTNAGIRITARSGKYSESYLYDNPAVLVALQRRRVAAYWNDHNPDADAVLLSIRGGRPHKFLGLAQRVKTVPRFGGTREQMTEEAHRKAAAMRYAAVESRSLAPYLQRSIPIQRTLPSQYPEIGTGRQTAGIGAQISAAAVRARETERVRAGVRREIGRVELEADDMAAAIANPRAPIADQQEFSSDEISELFNSEPTGGYQK